MIKFIFGEAVFGKNERETNKMSAPCLGKSQNQDKNTYQTNQPCRGEFCRLRVEHSQ